MSEVQTSVKANGNGSSDAVREFNHARGDDSHLQVIITQETYDAIQGVVTRATERGLNDGFEYWLEQCAKTGAQSKLRTWNDRDIVTLMNQAQNMKNSPETRKRAAEKILTLISR